MFHFWKSSINHRTFGRGQTWDIEEHFITELTRENSMWKKKILVNHVWPLVVNHATQWTVARQAPLPFLCPWNSPGKNTGVGSHSLLQWILLTQGLSPDVLQADFLPSEPLRKSNYKGVATRWCGFKTFLYCLLYIIFG